MKFAPFLLTLALAMCCHVVLTAQSIVNIEKRRIVTDTIGWAGSANLSFRFNKNVDKQFALSTTSHLQYKSQKTLYLLLGNVSLVEAGGKRFVNAGFIHFRINRKLGKVIRWEAFSQYQYNSILQVDQRTLIGTGPRLKLFHSDKFRLYQGTLYMFEHEEIISPEFTHDDHRISAYFSSVWEPSKTVQLTATWYYQPLIEQFADHRLSGNMKLGFSITEKLQFTTSFNYLRDSRPPTDVPKEVYSMSNGLSYSF